MTLTAGSLSCDPKHRGTPGGFNGSVRGVVTLTFPDILKVEG
jgi:hypothetical protein